MLCRTIWARSFQWCPFNLKGLLLCAALRTERFCDSDPARELLGNAKINSICTNLCTLPCNLDLFFVCKEMRFHSSWVTPEKILLAWQTKWNVKVKSPDVSATVPEHAAAASVRGCLQAQIMLLIESISLWLYCLVNQLSVWRVTFRGIFIPMSRILCHWEIF